MFAIFTRLTQDEGVPRTESLRPQARRPRWTRPDRGRASLLHAVIAVPLVLTLVAMFAFLAISTLAAPTCRSVAGLHAAQAQAVSCHSALQSQGRP